MTVIWHQDELMADVSEAMAEVEKEYSKKIADDARKTTLFKDVTGELRSSIKSEKSKFKNGGYITIAKAPHAHLIELGHRKIVGTTLNPNSPSDTGRTTGSVPARPFMRQALKKNQTKAIEAFKEIFK